MQSAYKCGKSRGKQVRALISQDWDEAPAEQDVDQVPPQSLSSEAATREPEVRSHREVQARAVPMPWGINPVALRPGGAGPTLRIQHRRPRALRFHGPDPVASAGLPADAAAPQCGSGPATGPPGGDPCEQDAQQ
ncbi:unnamed protein product, partial [Symbiodinium sp. CCMP2592]